MEPKNQLEKKVKYNQVDKITDLMLLDSCMINTIHYYLLIGLKAINMSHKAARNVASLGHLGETRIPPVIIISV